MAFEIKKSGQKNLTKVLPLSKPICGFRGRREGALVMDIKILPQAQEARIATAKILSYLQHFFDCRSRNSKV